MHGVQAGGVGQGGDGAEVSVHIDGFHAHCQISGRDPAGAVNGKGMFRCGADSGRCAALGRDGDIKGGAVFIAVQFFDLFAVHSRRVKILIPGKDPIPDFQIPNRPRPGRGLHQSLCGETGRYGAAEGLTDHVRNPRDDVVPETAAVDNRAGSRARQQAGRARDALDYARGNGLGCAGRGQIKAACKDVLGFKGERGRELR